MFRWLCGVALITLFCALVYSSVQQSLRLGANDPQIQMSEDIANALSGGNNYNSELPQTNIDISKSLGNFVIIYDKDGKVQSSTASLDGKTPTLPSGVLDYTNSHNQDRLTWQPKDGVRIAAVITKASGNGYVLVGRSLREVEIRENKMETFAVLAWIIGVGLITLPLVGKRFKF